MKFFILTDLHIGKPNITEQLVNNLISFFIDNHKVLSTVDYIVVDGDLFDRMLVSNSPQYRMAIVFITYLVSYCKKNNISLRILEGTPSHDNKQMENISIIIKEFNTIDYKYVSTLSIEYDKKHNKHYLYLPDKYRDTAEEIQDEIDKKLKEHNLSKVDMIFAHGNFKYQLPIKLKSGLDENFFLDRCNYYIVIGHIHNRSIWQRIIAPGSFDRLEVNQEEEKGGVLINIGDDIDDSSYFFINNKNALKHDTIDVSTLDVKDAYKAIRKHLLSKGYGKYDQLRIIASRAVYGEVNTMLETDGFESRIKRYDDTKKTNVVINEIVIKESDTLVITPTNVVDLILARDRCQSLSDNDKKRIAEIIRDA